MSYDDFWEGDAALPKFYREAFQLKQERELKQTNFSAWLNGLYAAKAYSVVLGNAFSKKDAQPLEYFDKPIELAPEKEEPAPDEREQAQLRMLVNLDNFVNFYKKKE